MAGVYVEPGKEVFAEKKEGKPPRSLGKRQNLGYHYVLYALVSSVLVSDRYSLTLCSSATPFDIRRGIAVMHKNG
jgi:hypothetical protein